MACSPPGCSVHGILRQGYGVGCLFLLQRVFFPTQGSDLGLPWCGRILHCLSPQGRPQLSEVSKRNLSCFRRGWHFPHCGHPRPVRPPRLRRAQARVPRCLVHTGLCAPAERAWLRAETQAQVPRGRTSEPSLSPCAPRRPRARPLKGSGGPGLRSTRACGPG